MPMLNMKCIDLAIKLNGITGGRLAKKLSFDRKHYSYRDLAAGYQITQYYNPISKGGKIYDWPIGGFHLEQDAGKPMLKNPSIGIEAEIL